ncbi:MAG: hypothetical protein ACYC9U_11105 [Nitrososphaerales archaeon]
MQFILKLVNTYFDMRGSYRRTSDSVNRKVSYVTIYRIIDLLGAGCKDPVQVANELQPMWWQANYRNRCFRTRKATIQFERFSI